MKTGQDSTSNSYPHVFNIFLHSGFMYVCMYLYVCVCIGMCMHTQVFHSICVEEIRDPFGSSHSTVWFPVFLGCLIDSKCPYLLDHLTVPLVHLTESHIHFLNVEKSNILKRICPNYSQFTYFSRMRST